MKNFIIYMSCNLTSFNNRNYLCDTYNTSSEESWTFYPSDATLFNKEEAEALAKEIEEAFAEYECYVDVEDINEI